MRLQLQIIKHVHHNSLLYATIKSLQYHTHSSLKQQGLKISDDCAKDMPGAWHLIGSIRRIFAKSSCKSVAVLDAADLVLDDSLIEENIASHAATKDQAPAEDVRNAKARAKLSTVEDLAAIKIQACFRGHLVCVCSFLEIWISVSSFMLY